MHCVGTKLIPLYKLNVKRVSNFVGENKKVRTIKYIKEL